MILDVTDDTTIGGDLTVTGNTSLLGNTDIGNADSDTVTFTAVVDSAIFLMQLLIVVI